MIVAHSFSAQMALAAASEQPEAVRAVVLVGGMIPRTGKNFLSLMPPMQRLALGVVMRLSRHGVTVPRDVAKRGYGPDLDIATMQLVLDRLVPEVPRFYLDPVEWLPLSPSIPVIYVRLLRDHSVNLTTQGEQAKLVRATRIETIESGHLPMLSRPTEMAEILNRVATQLT